MKRAHFTIAAGLFLVACGGGGTSNNNGPDANNTPHDAPNNTQIDAPNTHTDAQMTDGSTMTDSGTMTDGGTPPTCITSTLGAQDLLGDDRADGSIAWVAPITADIGDGGPSQLNLEFYDMIEPDLTVPFDLSMGNQNNYSTCALCMHGLSFDGTGTVARQFFQSAGTITLTEDPFTAGNMKGTITGLTVVEVTIDPDTFASTLVSGGKCILIGDVTLNHTPIPNAWTCAAAKYNDGATCDCMCGMSDPDCAIAAVPVAGCTGTQICPADTCEAWTCPVVSYNDGTNCNCGCGEHDPDCDISGAPVVGCTGTQVCGSNDMCMDFVPPACTINAALGTPTLTSQAATYDSADDFGDLNGLLNADALPDGFDLQLYGGSGVFTTSGVATGTYQLTGAETDYATCGACALLDGNIDTSSGTPAQTYMASAGMLNLTSITGNLTGTLTNATFAAVVIDPTTFESTPDGSNCAVSIDSLSFSAPITASMLKTGVIHVTNITNVKGLQRVIDHKLAAQAAKHSAKKKTR